MRIAHLFTVVVGCTMVASLPVSGRAGERGQLAASQPTSAATATSQKFTFILFWKEDNAATREMAAKLKAALATRADQAELTAVNVAETANQETVERYHVSRAPMPMALCVAANGATTGAITDKVTDAAVDKALVTPAMTLCMKAIQDERLVVVYARQDEKAGLPAGASGFAADPAFKARTTVVSFRRDDPNEQRFLKEMDISATSKGTVVALLAPPGVLVGKYSTDVSADKMASDLHAAGKCCNDPNCKNNKKGL